MEIIPVGENWFSISVDCERTAECARTIRSLHAAMTQRRFSGISSMRAGLDCLFVETDEDFKITAIQSFLQDFKEGRVLSDENAAFARIPVCFDAEYAPDLDAVSQSTGLARQQIIETFCSSVYEVWMIGFMPGYPYMGILDPDLRVVRKISPSIRVSAGSVAIADEFVGVYPFDSPGGWHVIGRTPLAIIDYSKSSPWLFEYRMKVQFYGISKDEFLDNDRW